MDRLISRLRQILIVFLLGLTIFVLQDFGYGILPAQAEAVTPEATSYQAKYKGSDSGTDSNLLESAKQNLKATADNVREKLNLDEPIDPGTKEVLNSTQERVEDSVKSITGKERDSYRDNLNR